MKKLIARLRYKLWYRKKVRELGEIVLSKKTDLQKRWIVLDRQEGDTRVVEAQLKLLGEILEATK